MKWLGRLFGALRLPDEAGDVLLEYVIVCSWIGIAVVKFMHAQFYDFDNGYVGMGLSIQKAFQRVLEGISLPVP